MDQRPAWLFVCNSLLYDVDGAFRSLKRVDWKQSISDLQVGDTVYLYMARIEKRIKYKCLVKVVNKPKSTIDDSKFVIDGEFYVDYGCYCELEVVAQYYSELLLYDYLVQHGLKSVQGPQRINEQLMDYIKSVT
jgi:5-methylcytosine-specific restriction enzyme A